ncbi:MAG: dihydroorotate dehydrogenase [Dehalococcoidia bacterium]|nr:dihydroorotate dehydrogenase [Dehalococcoidia bacterium]
MENTPGLAVNLAPRCGLKLANPVLTASGTFGYGDELASIVDIQRLGAIICKGTTLKPRAGNPQPRLAETPQGMLNAIGLQNPGVEALIRDKAPMWAQWQVPVIVNIAGESVAAYTELASRLDGVPGVAGLEINISCPNVAGGCLEFGADAASAAAVTNAVRVATALPIMVKLSPSTADIVNIAQAVAQAGADAISLINTFKGLTIDIKKRRPLLGNVTGGLSGPAIKPVALALVYAVASAVDIPIVGGGGIMTADDALEFIMAGATAVEVGTATFLDPASAISIIDGIADYLKREDVGEVATLIGCARP